jgi:hypothetical protein
MADDIKICSSQIALYKSMDYGPPRRRDILPLNESPRALESISPREGAHHSRNKS